MNLASANPPNKDNNPLSNHNLYFIFVGSDPMDMVASVTSPGGVTDLCDIVDQSDDHYTIKFVPKDMGVHTICVKHKGLHIPGSPFQFTVGPITEGGAHKVHANGTGNVQVNEVQYKHYIPHHF